eukprot:gb/GEZN01001868.1/.p1 GENE.gb/GEZN01001868.1/~~gb/GEZN01001868.1/.p1  ORF type:complete len:792 (+),score=253.75 gb/GEZN01001868.1/:72-2447(+)
MASADDLTSATHEVSGAVTSAADRAKIMEAVTQKLTQEELHAITSQYEQKLKRSEAKMKKLMKDKGQSKRTMQMLINCQNQVISLTKERDHGIALVEEMKFKLQESSKERRKRQSTLKKKASIAAMQALSTLAEEGSPSPSPAPSTHDLSSTPVSSTNSLPSSSALSAPDLASSASPSPAPAAQERTASTAAAPGRDRATSTGKAPKKVDKSAWQAMAKLQEAQAFLEKQLETERKKSKDKSHAEQELKKEIREHDRKVKDAQVQVDDMKAKLKVEQEAYFTLRTQLEAAAEKAAGLNTTVALLTNRLNVADQGLARAQEAFANLQTEKETVVHQREVEQAEANERLDKSQKEVGEWKAQYERELQARTHNDQKISDLHHDMERLEAEKKRLEEDKLGVERTLDERLTLLSQAKQEVEEQLQKKKEQIVLHEAELARLGEVEREHGRRGEQIAALEGKLDEAKQNISNLSQEVKELKSSIAQKDVAFSVLTEQKLQVESEKHALEEQLTISQAALHAMEQAKRELETELTSLKESYAAKEKHQQETAEKLHNVEDSEAKLKHQLHDTTQELEELREKQEATSKELKKAVDEEIARKKAIEEANKSVQCEMCGAWTTQQWLEDHKNEVCQKRTRDCFLGCGAKFPASELSKHLKDCPKYQRKQFAAPEEGTNTQIINKGRAPPPTAIKNALLAAATEAASVAREVLESGSKVSPEEKLRLAREEKEKADRAALDAWEREYDESLFSEDDEEEDDEEDDGEPLTPVPPPKPPSKPKPAAVRTSPSGPEGGKPP